MRTGPGGLTYRPLQLRRPRETGSLGSFRRVVSPCPALLDSLALVRRIARTVSEKTEVDIWLRFILAASANESKLCSMCGHFKFPGLAKTTYFEMCYLHLTGIRTYLYDLINKEHMFKSNICAFGFTSRTVVLSAAILIV